MPKIVRLWENSVLSKYIKRYKKTALVLFGVWTVAGLCFGGFFAFIGNPRNGDFLLQLAENMARYYFWGLQSPLIFILAKRYDITHSFRRWRNGFINLSFGIFLCLLFPIIFDLLHRQLSERYVQENPSIWDSLSQNLPITAIYTLISFYIPTLLAAHAILYFRRYLSEQTQNLTLRSDLSDARLNALKMQLHPHFLFNSLHAISSLIAVDPQRANRMIALLGDFLRQTLDHSNDQLVPLQEELEFLRCYLAIEETRFADRLSVHFDLETQTLRDLVPHLILQPLVENAVKHGVAPFAAPGRIEIASRRTGEQLYLIVVNSIPDSDNHARQNPDEASGVGIKNVRSRLEYLYGESASLSLSEDSVKGFRVELIIPVGGDKSDFHLRGVTKS